MLLRVNVELRCRAQMCRSIVNYELIMHHYQMSVNELNYLQIVL